MKPCRIALNPRIMRYSNHVWNELTGYRGCFCRRMEPGSEWWPDPEHWMAFRHAIPLRRAA